MMSGSIHEEQQQFKSQNPHHSSVQSVIKMPVEAAYQLNDQELIRFNMELENAFKDIIEIVDSN